MVAVVAKHFVLACLDEQRRQTAVVARATSGSSADNRQQRERL
jgi:hypothetical protein